MHKGWLVPTGSTATSPSRWGEDRLNCHCSMWWPCSLAPQCICILVMDPVADQHQCKGVVAAGWISGWLHCGRWMSRECATVPDSIKGGITAEFLNSWKDCFCLWNHAYLWLLLMLTKEVSCTTVRVRWLDVLQRRCESHSSKELSNSAGKVNSLTEVCLQDLAVVPHTPLWKLALVKWELVPRVGQSWAEVTGSARCPWVKYRLGWNFYLFPILCWIQWFFGLIINIPFFHLKIFHKVAEKLKDKEELTDV